MRAKACWMVVLVALAGCGEDDTNGVGDGAIAEVTEDTSVFVPDMGGVDTAQPDTEPAVDTWKPPEPGEFGYACDENTDCNSGWCIQTADGRRCTRTCTEECPPGFDCREAPSTDAIFICMPRFTNLCDPCGEAADCNQAGQVGNYCLSYGAKGRFCGAGCTDDASCPGDYVCRLVPIGGGGEATQCVPPDGAECSCSPLAKALQKSTTCFIENTHGKCNGKRFCTQSGLNSCDAKEPFPESCNGLDDNCNGVTDEFPPDYQCMITNEFGSCPGQGTCTDGVETCVGEAPRPEQCNGIDDDCDGETDEELCDDNNPCTIDFCNSVGQCQHTNDNTALCDDGSVCTQVDKCVDGFCMGFNPLPCGDGNPCFSYQCDPTVGCLSQFANGAACEDGQPCTKSDTCNNGVCVPGNWDTCDDGNSCTVDSCVAGQGCTHTPAQNGIACGGAGSGQCQVGQCSNGLCIGAPVANGTFCTLPNLSACQVASCQAGTCLAQSVPPGTGCTVGSHPQCKQGSCAGSTCVPVAGIACNDGKACTVNDRCSAGQCAGDEKDCNAECQAANPGQFCVALGVCTEFTSNCLAFCACF